MKKVSKAFVIIIISLVILGLTLPLLNIFAQENLQAPLKDVENKVGELIELKDDDTLSEKEKEERKVKLSERQQKKETEEQVKQRQKDRPIKEGIAQKIYFNIQEKAFKSIEYKTADITCNICSC